MEQNLQRRVAGLRDKMPDIEKTLETVRFLKLRNEGDDEGEGGEIETTFELNDTLYAKAKIGRTEEVYLWLGANVMLSYPIEEAEELLDGKLEAARRSLGNCEEDLDFLREQITVGDATDYLLTILFWMMADWDDRLWRLRWLGFITGMWCRNGRRRRRRRSKGKGRKRGRRGGDDGDDDDEGGGCVRVKIQESLKRNETFGNKVA